MILGRKSISFLIVICLVACLVFVGKETDTFAAGWSISASSKTIYDDEKFTLTIKGVKGTPVVKSANKKIAKVKKISNKKYSIIGVKKGSVNISIKVGSQTKTCKVTVKSSALDPTKTKFIAHRGLSKEAPENTKSAFIKAGKQAFYAIETDIQVTKDNKFICMHDKSLKRMCGVNKSISKLTYKEIRSYKINSGSNIKKLKDDSAATTIPSLDEFLDICIKYDKVPYVEIKGDYTNKQLELLYKAIVNKMGKKRCYVFALDSKSSSNTGMNRMKYFHKLVKEGNKSNIKMAHLDSSGQDSVNTLLKYDFETGFKASNVSGANIASYQKQNIPVIMYTINGVKTAKQVVKKYDVDYITTDSVLWK